MSLRLTWNEAPVPCTMQPPASKSDTLRLLFLRHARGEKIDSLTAQLPGDVAATALALRLLASDNTEIALNMGIGGAPFRFALALACMTPGLRCSIDADEPLRRRPHHPLISALSDSLRSSGLNLDSVTWPMRIDTAELKLPEDMRFEVDPTSSQYLSALALAGAAAVGKGLCNSITIKLKQPTASSGYAELTAHWIEQAGFSLKVTEREWQISGYSPATWNPEIPTDWSAAAYLLVWAWKTGGSVEVSGPEDHPDSSVIEILANAGLVFQREYDTAIMVSGELQKGIHADAAACPDLIPTLGVMALAAPGISHFVNVGILRDKESDRLEFLVDLAQKVGANAKVISDELIVHPAGDKHAGVSIATLHDHRRAMAGSLLLPLGWPEVTIDEPDCVSKSFPGYWEVIGKCGVAMEENA